VRLPGGGAGAGVTEVGACVEGEGARAGQSHAPCGRLHCILIE
jgi:hypothetical protein